MKIFPIHNRSRRPEIKGKGYLVESTIIHTESKGAILFLDKQNWGADWKLGMLDEPLGKVFSKVITQGLEFQFQ